MAQITEAWGILSDPLKRERHDRLLASLQGERRNRVYKDVLRESQINAYKHARSWAEFEKIYLKAYDTFKWDLEHSERNMKGIDPFALRSAGESIIVWIYNCVTGEIFVVSRSPTMVDTHKPGGVAVFFILMISMTVGLGLGALFRILFG